MANERTKDERTGQFDPVTKTPDEIKADLQYNHLVRLLLHLEGFSDRYTHEPSLPTISMKDLAPRQILEWWRSEKKLSENRILAEAERIRQKKNLARVRASMSKDDLKMLEADIRRKEMA